MMTGVLEIAEQIACKSPVAIQGTKTAIVYGRDHSVQEGLDQMVSITNRKVNNTLFSILPRAENVGSLVRHFK